MVTALVQCGLIRRCRLSGLVGSRGLGELSVAARQIVEISRAIAAEAKIILMDEPTSSLQRDDVSQLFSLIRKLSSEGISVVYISHFLEEVRQISDRFTVLRDGRSVASGDISFVTDDELEGYKIWADAKGGYFGA